MKRSLLITLILLAVIATTVFAVTDSGVQSIDRKGSHVRIDGAGEIRVEPRSDKSVTFTVATKSARFDLASITAAATRTVTFPDANTKLPVASQFLTFTGPTVARSYVLPDAATTLCGTNAVCTGYQSALTNPVVGSGSGYKVARGVATITGSGTVVTGLTTVVSIVATMQSDASLTNGNSVTATIGDQAGAPAAGSVIIKVWKPTANNDTTPTASEAAVQVNWIAVGT